MIYFLLAIIAILLFLFFITFFNALTAPMLKDGPEPLTSPLVSVLIPARNEEQTIGTCVASLLEQDYPRLEIIVLNDESSDRTPDIVKEFQTLNKEIHLFEGTSVPAGWTGKNWACHQLADHAGGEIFLFTDADNYFAPDAISNTVGWIQKLNVSLFSCFPQQSTKTFGEKLVVPVFDMFVYSLLPLWFTYWLKFPSMAAANGQWIAFTEKGYNRIGGHSAVRRHVVEDTELSRLAKKKGEKVITAVGTGSIFGRMYRSWPEVFNGFSKNAFGLMGYKTIPFFISLVLLISLYIIPYFTLFFKELMFYSAIAVILILAQRFIVALKYKQPLFVSTILCPVTIAATVLVGINSFILQKRGRIQWKGREITF